MLEKSTNLNFQASFPDLGKEFFPRLYPDVKMTELMKARETRKQTSDIVDSDHNKLCKIEFDQETGDVISILPERYINKEQSAENLSENIYTTDEKGQITAERLTRAEAREGNKRYLIVTTIILYDDKILIQTRSDQKKIDSGLESSSAHGVAKELFTANNERIIDVQNAALINSALEINEELRHDAEPFQIKVWNGPHDELHRYVETNQLSDPNTIWLVPEAYIPDDTYPLYSISSQARSRAISSGFIFSKKNPEISVDPNEVEKSQWLTISKVLQNPNTAHDLPIVAEFVIRRILDNSPWVKRFGRPIAERIIRNARGEIKERTD